MLKTKSALRPPVVFLDTARPDAQNRASFLFMNPVKVLKTKKFSEVRAILEEIDALRKKYWIAGFLAYEAGYVFEEKFRPMQRPTQSNKGHLAWFGVFRKPVQRPHPGLAFRPKPSQAPVNIRPGLAQKTYTRAIRKIRSYIARGHTYQVNYTFDVFARTGPDPFSFYAGLRQKQRTPYCAYIDTGEERVLSFSPELFFRITGNTIIVKPMKGTAARGFFQAADQKAAKALARDPKNRAENLMIVDLLRNDLGRICRTGSVKTRRMFEVETHPTLHQMTSTVQGRLRPGAGLSDVFQNIFPSGSVTGAPKIRTMEIIRSLEKGARGVYCGAIGYAAPSGRAVFNVPIRTLQQRRGERAWRFRVGSGIVWDSTAKGEWEECGIKCRFLDIGAHTSFEIFESLLWRKRLVFLKEHEQRLKRSAAFFGYPFDSRAYRALITKIQKALKNRGSRKVRIFLDSAGNFRWDRAALGAAPVNLDSKAACVWKKPINRENVFLYHKTTRREWYHKAMDLIRQGKYYDAVFFNEQGELTEGARTNVFVRIRGKLYTPPVSCGLLPGVLRERLLKQGKCFEKILKKVHLKRAEAVYCGNSVRGLVEVKLTPQTPQRGA
jgi:para-aminobenzoate synthetase/4-amino-4-deoxychorismate lyase